MSRLESHLCDLALESPMGTESGQRMLRKRLGVELSVTVCPEASACRSARAEFEATLRRSVAPLFSGKASSKKQLPSTLQTKKWRSFAHLRADSRGARVCESVT